MSVHNLLHLSQLLVDARFRLVTMGQELVELRHLRYFIGIAENLSFSRAAERLHVAQSAFSRQIQDLEEELKVKIFKRDKRGVSLSAAGWSMASAT